MAVVIDRFFDKKEQVIGKYGANLAVAVLPGGGHRILHNQLQSLVWVLIKSATLTSHNMSIMSLQQPTPEELNTLLCLIFMPATS